MRRFPTSLAVTLALLTALAVATFGLAGTSDAKQTAAQKSFRKILLNDSAVDPAIKTLLGDGGFVERRMIFSDFTGEGKSDAIVFVNSGAISGTVASYVLSSERGRELRVVHIDESGYQVAARADEPDAGDDGLPRLILEDPVFAAGSPPCCARLLVRRTYEWNTRTREFRLLTRKRVRSGVRLSR